MTGKKYKMQKTVINKNPNDFDEQVNTLVRSGYKVKQRQIIGTSSDYIFCAFLQKKVREGQHSVDDEEGISELHKNKKVIESEGPTMKNEPTLREEDIQSPPSYSNTRSSDEDKEPNLGL